MKSKTGRVGGAVVYLLAILVIAAVTVAITLLLENISHRKAEARVPYVRLQEVTEDDTDPEKWGVNWPKQFDAYKRTAQSTRTRFGGHGGSEAMPDEKIERDPWLKRMFLGYAFSIDYRDRRDRQLAPAHGHQIVQGKRAAANQPQIRPMQGGAALAAAIAAPAAPDRGFIHGRRSRRSPRRKAPGVITLAKIPSRGMIQSPTCLKMAQPWWHFLPIWVTSSTTSPLLSRVPMGRCAKSRPSVVMFDSSGVRLT